VSSTRSTSRDEELATVVQAVRADPRLRERERRRMRAVEKARLGAEIVVTHVRVRRRIAAMPLPELLAQLRRGVADRGVPAGQAAAEHVTAVRLARAVMAVLRRLPGDTRCLTQSLVLTALLARRGIGSTLRIAVAPGETFAAHAWVEHGGVPVLPAEHPGFGELAAL
jgi:hypothetical protein